MCGLPRPGVSKRPIFTVLGAAPIPRLLLDDALPPLSQPCRAQYAVRSGCCADLLSVDSPFRLAEHQRRELRRSVATIAGYIQKRSADGRYMAGTAGV